MKKCNICGKTNKKISYYSELNEVLCESCYKMCKKYPFKYIPPAGEIHYDNDGSILCHVCGRSFKKLSTHISSKHNMTTDEYREKFGLNRNSKLTGKNFIPNITVDITTVSKNTRFYEGHKINSDKTKRLQGIKSNITKE